MKLRTHTPSEFHQSAAAAVDKMSRCLQEGTLRHCVYNTEVIPTEFNPSVNILDVMMEKTMSYTVMIGAGKHPKK